MTKELQLALRLTKKVNKLLSRRFNRKGSSSIHFKKYQEIVTNTDIEANEVITKELIKTNFDIISEEAAKIDRPGTTAWYIDPIDGTTNFAYGFPYFATCLSLKDKENIKCGVVGLPMMKEIYWAEKNKGAWCNHQKIKVSKNNTIENGFLLLCRGHSPKSQRRFYKFFNNLIKKSVGHFRQFSCAGIELTAVASGQADACVMAYIHPWDVLAGILLVREAGGKVTNWQGQNWKITDNNLIASNGFIHNEILKLTKNIK